MATITSETEILDQFHCKIPVIAEHDQDWPGQNDESRVHAVTQALVDFVSRTADKHTRNPEEEAVVLWSIAMTLLGRFQGNALSALMRRSLDERFKNDDKREPQP